MLSDVRRVRLRALAKVNLNLEVLHRRSDGFHEIRTIFQTVSLADILELNLTPSKRSRIELVSTVAISENLVGQAAELVMNHTGMRGELRCRLLKRIPMGAGLGGGSSDAAAVLLALPALGGAAIRLPDLLELGSRLGSDVPFFLLGGCVLGLGRGEEIYPLPAVIPAWAIIVDPQIHVSTADAYSALNRPLTSDGMSLRMNTSQSCALGIAGDLSASAAMADAANDFEPVIFRQYPDIDSIKRKLQIAGAKPALLSGSGAAVFGMFETREKRDRALESLNEKVYPVRLVGRPEYRKLWRRQLREHVIAEDSWPPRSRYAQ